VMSECVSSTNYKLPAATMVILVMLEDLTSRSGWHSVCNYEGLVCTTA
jgi:hypothetical protein